jgi:hypothetical protein
MIIVEKNQILSIRERTSKKIISIKNMKTIKIGDSVNFAIEGDSVKASIGSECMDNLGFGVLHDIVRDLLLNERYQYRAKIETISYEERAAIIELEIYRIVDLENDPFVYKTDFQLIKTTKNDNGEPRQSAYYKTNIMDILFCYRDAESIYVRNQNGQTLGEIGSKGIDFLNENNGEDLFYKLLDKTRNESGNYIGIIRVYKIMR